MDKDELQREFKIRISQNATGSTIVMMMPEDIVTNTRRAFNVSATSANGYGGLGAPEGRYIAPASTGDCIFLYPGDCGAPKSIVINGPTFVRLDFRATKRFMLGGAGVGRHQLRSDEHVRQHQLQPGVQPGRGQHDLPGDERVP